MSLDILFRDKVFPEPVFPPQEDDLLNGYLFGLREEEEDEACHDEDQPGKEQEDAVFQMTKSHKETLSD